MVAFDFDERKLPSLPFVNVMGKRWIILGYAIA